MSDHHCFEGERVYYKNFETMSVSLGHNWAFAKKRCVHCGKTYIYVNPDNPAESVYIKGVSKPNLGAMAFAFAMGLFGVLLVGMGLKNIVKD